MSEYQFKGSGRYDKNKIYKEYSKKGDIVKSVLTDLYNNETLVLENNLTITEKPNNMLYMYHSYDTQNYSARWYKIVHKNLLNGIINNKLSIPIISDNENFIMTIEFTNNGINKLKKI